MKKKKFKNWLKKIKDKMIRAKQVKKKRFDWDAQERKL